MFLYPWKIPNPRVQLRFDWSRSQNPWHPEPDPPVFFYRQKSWPQTTFEPYSGDTKESLRTKVNPSTRNLVFLPGLQSRLITTTEQVLNPETGLLSEKERPYTFYLWKLRIGREWREVRGWSVVVGVGVRSDIPSESGTNTSRPKDTHHGKSLSLELMTPPFNRDWRFKNIK